MKLRVIFLNIFLLISSFLPIHGNDTISRSFELIFFTNNPKANGETDFKGETEFFTTQQRVDFLTRFADYASEYYNDKNLDRKVIKDEEVFEALQSIKEQPVPATRQRILLNKWRWYHYYGKNQKEIDLVRTAMRHSAANKQDISLDTDEMIVLDRFWSKEQTQNKETKVVNGELVFTNNDAEVKKIFTPQYWRFSFQWDYYLSHGESDRHFFFLENFEYPVVKIWLSDGNLYSSNGEKKSLVQKAIPKEKWYHLKIEVDFENRWYNLYIDDELVVATNAINTNQFLELLRFDLLKNEIQRNVFRSGKDQLARQVNTFHFKGARDDKMDNVWGVGYAPGPHIRLRPYTVNTFLDETFDVAPMMTNWSMPNYTDSDWFDIDKLPLIYGGEKNYGKDIYMRARFTVNDFKKAFLNIQAVDPSGELYINGHFVQKLERFPQKIDVGRYLKTNSNNLIAIKVDHVPKGFYLDDGHTNYDMLFGSFAHEIFLDLHDDTFIDDIFVYTSKLHDDGAKVQSEITLRNLSRAAINGKIQVAFYPWFPHESQQPAFVHYADIALRIGETKIVKDSMLFPSPELWTYETPNLYKVEATLINDQGKVVDDLVVTTGIRTVSQENGTFRINGEPEMMNGALSFHFPAPFEKISEWNRCMPDYWVVKEILMVKKLGGNALRLNGMSDNYSDPRFAKYADQLGLMFYWTQSGWNRKEWTEFGDYWSQRVNLNQQVEEFRRDVIQVRNHPSVVIWELYDENLDPDRIDLLFSTFYPVFYDTHPGILFMFMKDLPADEPQTTNGTYGWALDYGREWSALRKWPDGIRERDTRGRPMSKLELLTDTLKAYFDTETGELIGQPNWNLVRGKPWYHVRSYEWYADYGNIGVRLNLEQWRESQAWQAFGGYHLSKKQRMYDIDGMTWVVLRGGGNSVTYMKPLIDYYDHAKLAFYTFRTVIQKVFAGTSNVDMIYGPADKISPVMMSLGESQEIDLILNIRNIEDNKIIASRTYESIVLPEGKGNVFLDDYHFIFPNEGYYTFEFEAIKAK